MQGDIQVLDRSLRWRRQGRDDWSVLVLLLRHPADARNSSQTGFWLLERAIGARWDFSQEELGQEVGCREMGGDVKSSPLIRLINPYPPMSLFIFATRRSQRSREGKAEA